MTGSHKKVRWYLDERLGPVFRWTFPAPTRMKDVMLRNFHIRDMDQLRDVLFEDLYSKHHE